jgi:hypothetical protein
MKTFAASMGLPFAFAALNAAALSDPIIESLPGSICLVEANGQAALYRQYVDEGLFAPHVKSTEPVKETPTGFKAIVSNVMSVSQPVLREGLMGQFESAAIEFDAKSKAWRTENPAKIDVYITGWKGSEPSGKCVGHGKHTMTGIIVSKKNYMPIAPDNPFFMHIGLHRNGIPSSLLKTPAPSRD